MHSSRKETRTAARRTLPRYPGREPRCLFPTSTGCSSPPGPIPANRRPYGSSVQHLEAVGSPPLRSEVTEKNSHDAKADNLGFSARRAGGTRVGAGYRIGSATLLLRPATRHLTGDD